MTYVFSQDPLTWRRYLKDKKGKTLRDSMNQKRKGPTKRSYLKLIEQEYAGVIKRVFDENRRIKPVDLRNNSAADDLVLKVVNFQRRRLASLPEKYKKYAKYATRPVPDDNPPMFILPPYFYANSVGSDSWHAVSIDLARRARSITTDLPVFGIIFSDVKTIESSGAEIIRDFAAIRLDGFVLWINDFNGNQKFQNLLSVRDFVRDLSVHGPVITMYGDAFSLVLSYAGLHGYCCGICYAERKSADQDVDVEGTLPARYYIKQLKKKVQINEARRIPLAAYGFDCECEICARQPDAALLDDLQTREHFMLVRREEIETIRAGQSSARFAEVLQRAYETSKDEPLLAGPPNLSSWSRLLS